MTNTSIALRLTSSTLEPWQEACLLSLNDRTGVNFTDIIFATNDQVNWPANLSKPTWHHETQVNVALIFEKNKPLFILDLSERPDPSTYAPFGELGSWWFFWGDTGYHKDAGILELWRKNRSSLVALVQNSPAGAISILESGSIKTISYSLSKTRQRLLDTVVDWPSRVLFRIQRGIVPEKARHIPELQLREVPVWRRMLVPIICSRNAILRLFDEAIKEQWSIGLIKGKLENVALDFDSQAIEWLPEWPRGFVADPFPLEHEGKVIIFAEGYQFNERVGHIVAIPTQSPNQPLEATEVLRLPFHCSYPHVIHHEGEVYLVPETAAVGCIQLYRSVSFPWKWEADRVLIENFPGVDPTVLKFDGYWWLFAGDQRDQAETKLYLFFSKDLFGPWKPHPLNPVKSDLGGSRPAGTPFFNDGRLFRPAQDGTRTYGGSIVINEVHHLTPEVFFEEKISAIHPCHAGAYPDGLHTISGVGNITVVDGKRHDRSLRAFCAGLLRLMRELRSGRV